MELCYYCVCVQNLGPKTCGGPKHGPWCPLGWLGRPSPPTGQWHPPSNTLHPPPCFFFMVLGGCLGVQVVHPHGGPHHAPHVATCNPPHTLPTLGGHGSSNNLSTHLMLVLASPKKALPLSICGGLTSTCPSSMVHVIHFFSARCMARQMNHPPSCQKQAQS